MGRFRPRLFLGFAFLVMGCGGGGSGSDGDAGNDDSAAAGLLLRWRAVANVAGYVIHWGPASGTYTHAVEVVEPTPGDEGVVTFVLVDVDGMGTVYFALTSYDAAGKTSAFSNELSAVVP